MSVLGEVDSAVFCVVAVLTLVMIVGSCPGDLLWHLARRLKIYAITTAVMKILEQTFRSQFEEFE